VYTDKWPVQVSPICPWCGDGWYEDTDDAKCKPTRKRFRIYEPQVDMQIEMSTFWQRYMQVRRYLEYYNIDEDIVHRRALSAAGAGVSPNLAKHRQQALCDMKRRKRKEVELVSLYRKEV